MSDRGVKRGRPREDHVISVSSSGDKGGILGTERIFPCVRLRGLPFDASEQDIIQFMGINPIDLLMVKRDGRFCGEAFLLFGAREDVDLALTKDKGYLGRRYVEVFRAKKQEYYKAVVHDVTDGLPMRPIAGLEHATSSFGARYDQVEPAPSFPHSRYTEGVSGNSMQGRNRYSPNPNQSLGNLPSKSTGTTILKLRGLPYNVRTNEVREWFEDPQVNPTPVAPLNVYLITELGRPSGVAYVEFATPQEATVAMGKDRQLLGSRYIEVFPSARSDLDKLLSRNGYSSF